MSVLYNNLPSSAWQGQWNVLHFKYFQLKITVNVFFTPQHGHTGSVLNTYKCIYHKAYDISTRAVIREDRAYDVLFIQRNTVPNDYEIRPVIRAMLLYELSVLCVILVPRRTLYISCVPKLSTTISHHQHFPMLAERLQIIFFLLSR